MSEGARRSIPEAPVPSSAPASGNMLSNIAPPSVLPNLVTAQIAVVPLLPQPTEPSVPLQPPPAVRTQQDDSPDKFSPAIPPNKGEPTVAIRSPEGSQTTTQSPMSLPDSTPDREEIGDPMPGSGLFTWMKDAVSTGGLLHRVAEKAKSSVDSMITTLDPQMKEYLNSGGDIHIVVASDKESKVSPIREAFQAVFGKATVMGLPAESSVTATQPVGVTAAYAAAKQRLAYLRSQHSQLHNNVPLVAVEGFLLNTAGDLWFDMSLLVLSQPSLNIELQILTQSTSVPQPVVAALQAATPSDYPLADTGFATTVGSIMGANLHCPHSQWQETATGVSRRDMILLAARSLAGSYNRILELSSAAPT